MVFYARLGWFQIRIWCAKSEWAVPALEHKSKKLQIVNFSVPNQGGSSNQKHSKSEQDVPNQAIPSVKFGKVKSV